MPMGGGEIDKCARIMSSWTFKVWLPDPIGEYFRMDVQRSTMVHDICAKITSKAQQAGGTAFQGKSAHLVVKDSNTRLDRSASVEKSKLFLLQDDRNVDVDLCATKAASLLVRKMSSNSFVDQPANVPSNALVVYGEHPDE